MATELERLGMARAHSLVTAAWDALNAVNAEALTDSEKSALRLLDGGMRELWRSIGARRDAASAEMAKNGSPL